MPKRKITDINLYDLLEVSVTATEQELKKAYRRKALQCHPDKNPDNPKAADLFVELSEALEILTDPKAREAYDRTLKAKELAVQRLKGLDIKRRKLKEELEKREREAKESSTTSKLYNPVSDEQKLMNELERLKKEGSKVLQEEQEFIRQQLKSKLFPSASSKTSKNVPDTAKNDPTPSFEEYEASVLRTLKEAAQKQQNLKNNANSTNTSTNVE